MRILTQIAHAASVVTLLVAGDAWLAPSPADAQDAQTSQATPASVWAIARGGQLYDKWWAVTDADPPEGTHPSYPADGQQSGLDTWRCKECHGWDYKGVDGAYGRRGPHYTGIKGVRGVVGADIASIVDIIRDDTHRYTESMITASAAKKLAQFLSAGQVDMDLYIDQHSTVSRYIDRATKMARGEVLHGAQFYRAICATCHGLNGKAINVGDDDNPAYVATVAVDDPWAVLHKIRFGQPGFGMVSLSVLPIQDEIDILAYVQTLPLR